jgi:hypothetical protein
LLDVGRETIEGVFRRRQTDREFMRELLLRMERSERQHAAAIEELIADLRDHRGEWRAGHEAWWKEWREYQEQRREEHEDALAEQRAGREALFRMLDRLGPGGATA